jgi:plasmid stability protein
MGPTTAITIRKLPESAKQRLRMRAAAHGRSMEAEARAILLDALDQSQRVDLSWIEELIAIGDEVGGVELEPPPDAPATAADFTEP